MNLLAIPELTRHLSHRVQYEMIRSGEWQPREEELTPALLAQLANLPAQYRNVRPVLRRLESLTTDEAKACFRLAFRREPSAGFHYTAHDGTLTVYDNTLRLVVDQVNPKGERWRDLVTDAPVSEPVPFRLFAVIEYLESLAIDLRGLLKDGRAVAAP
ncbi:hypothetical protein [Spirosoma agri]|uniref:Uncharacterized protein n=1 Tax=Spirosoma agri TaxID=1987381 RepID=A0A6M0IGW7_9BACT|nr:hypothetical protein [Spirosoma agri]NEU66935.1 hypothetical protein [Spirosoma agri]